MNSIIKLDDLWMGRPRSIATALLESDGHRTIVDPGPGSTLETLRQGLRSRSISVSDLVCRLLLEKKNDTGRVRQRHLGEGFLGLYGQHGRLGSDGGGRRAGIRLYACRDA